MAKTERAKQHVHELEAELVGFLNSHPYEVGTDDDTEPGKRLYKLTRVECPPERLALIAGDVVHNLRAALDLLVWQLVIANGKTPGKNDGFPINETAKIFEAGGVPKIKGRISDDAVKVIRAAKPYKGGNDALWRLHHLDIADKHRVLYLVGSAFQSFSVPVPIIEEFDPEIMAGMVKLASETFYRPADRMFPLKEGDVIFIDNEPAQPKADLNFRFDVAFGQGEIVEGEPILEALHDLVGATEQTIELFPSFFDG